MITQVISFAILFLFLYARSLARKDLKKHIKLVSISMCCDLLLVVFLVVKRRALDSIHTEMSEILIIHIFFAISTLIGYGIISTIGYKVYKGAREYIKQLKIVDKFVITLRVLTSVTSLVYYLIEKLHIFQ